MRHPGLILMRLLAPLPLPLLRALGVCLGWVLYLLALPRRLRLRGSFSAFAQPCIDLVGVVGVVGQGRINLCQR